METPPTLDVPPPAASSAPRRARRKTYPLSLGVSLVLHVSLGLVAWAHHPFAVMAGGVEASRGTFTVAIAPKRGASFREAASAQHEFAPEEPVEDLGVVEDSLVLPEPEVVPVEVPEVIARPEQPLLGGAPAPDVDWESHPWNFRAPPQEAVPSRPSGADVAGKQGTDTGEAAAAGATGAIVVAGPVGPVGSELTSSTHGGNAVSPGVEGGNGPVLIRERSKDPEYPQRAQQRRIEGKVLLRITVTSRGAVSEVVVVESSGHSILDRAAVAGVEKWVFEPAKRDGVPVETAILHYITFKLDDA